MGGLPNLLLPKRLPEGILVDGDGRHGVVALANVFEVGLSHSGRPIFGELLSGLAGHSMAPRGSSNETPAPDGKLPRYSLSVNPPPPTP